MKKIFYLFLIFALSFTASAQDDMFVLYSMKGNVSVISNKVESKAKIGTILKDDAIIKVPQGSFATLICNETRMFSLTKSGNYPVSNLKDSCKESKSSFSANYVKYMWSEFTKEHGTPEKNRKNYMANVGAVGRGDINNVWVDPRLDSVNYVSGTIPLSWKSYTEADDFDFKLYDDSKTKVLLARAVKKKHVDISELLKLIQPGKVYYWSASVKGEPENEDRKYLRYVTKDNYVAFYNSVKQHDVPESDAEMNFRLGFVLEENHYIAEAYTHYLKSTQLDPANSLYRFTFMSFKKDFEIK